MKKTKQGFISFILVIFASSIILSFVFAMSIEDGTFFDQTVRRGYRIMNYYNAYSCLNQAILAISHDYFFHRDKVWEIKEFHCKILKIDINGDERLIYSMGDFMNALVYRKAKVRLLDNSLEIVSID